MMNKLSAKKEKLIAQRDRLDSIISRMEKVEEAKEDRIRKRLTETVIKDLIKLNEYANVPMVLHYYDMERLIHDLESIYE